MTMHDPSFADLVGTSTPMTPEESDAEHAANIDVNRRIARKHLGAAATELRLMDRALNRLGPMDLYDVEVAESSTQVLIANARAQIDVAMAALDSTIPPPEEP